MRPPSRVLIVDDEAQIVELLQLTLEMHGMQVRTAVSGPEALEMAGQHSFDVIIMDVLMVPWDGFETVRRLGARMGPALPPVVFLSGLNLAEDLPRVPGLRAEYLVKPFRPAHLIEALNRVVRKS